MRKDLNNLTMSNPGHLNFIIKLNNLNNLDNSNNLDCLITKNVDRAIV